MRGGMASREFTSTVDRILMYQFRNVVKFLPSLGSRLVRPHRTDPVSIEVLCLLYQNSCP